MPAKGWSVSRVHSCRQARVRSSPVLWDLPDQSTSEMMDRMYQQIAAGVAPEESLRQAKLSFLHATYSKPYYWGPFQYYTRRPVAALTGAVAR